MFCLVRLVQLWNIPSSTIPEDSNGSSIESGIDGKDFSSISSVDEYLIDHHIDQNSTDLIHEDRSTIKSDTNQIEQIKENETISTNNEIDEKKEIPVVEQSTKNEW